VVSIFVQLSGWISKIKKADKMPAW